ncbi:hypothetical protein ANCCAN_19697 [Ancylostoma caninum]|uniref:Uncharacterized protein n=1 Tax=Ancylostoma caninum TaxID=29170 RepID=A0A368FUJ6_ANCCA|nr:hypothetical protein ANCCAN_19697 [Ancylostoma caninum]
MTSRLDPPDEGAALPADESSTSGLGSDQMSRRRLAFRPPVEQRPLSTSGTRSESASGECSTSAGCGKDFDGVMRIMAKRKVDKNKEQTKNYYFNLLKHVKQSISLDEDSMGDIGRDAKELFITINACEWRRRTGSNQYIPERMKELIFHGCTTMPFRDKSRKKSVPVKIKTPPCPSLLKFFYNNQLDKFPPEIVVSLKPMTYADASYVVSCEQNPLLRIRLSTNDPISRIFQLLRHKWASLLDKMDANGSRRSSGPRPEIRLFAGKDTEVGRVILSPTELSPAVGLSLNKLRKEREDREALKSKRSRNAQVNTEPSYTVRISHNFILNEEVIKNGLCEENVGDAIVAEIYCLGPQTPVVVQPVLSESAVVLEEYDNFAEQYNALRGKKANNRRSSSRALASSSNQKQITSFIAPRAATTALRVETTGSSADIMLGKQGELDVKSPIVVSQYKARCVFERAMNQNKGNGNEKAATDFSELCPTSFAHDFLSSLRTPEKTPAKSKPDEERTDIMNRLFGGELSMSPTRASEHTSSSFRPQPDDSSRCDLMERALSEASLTPSKMKAYIMPQQGSGTLPDDVRTSMVEMMNQDSRDYVKQFEQLANTITAPRNRRGDRTPIRKKKKR